jgi:hypothetical protein
MCEVHLDPRNQYYMYEANAVSCKYRAPGAHETVHNDGRNTLLLAISHGMPHSSRSENTKKNHKKHFVE